MEQFQQKHFTWFSFVPSLCVIKSLSYTFLHDIAIMLKNEYERIIAIAQKQCARQFRDDK